jgi:hypothetical protein
VWCALTEEYIQFATAKTLNGAVRLGREGKGREGKGGEGGITYSVAPKQNIRESQYSFQEMADIKDIYQDKLVTLEKKNYIRRKHNFGT